MDALTSVAATGGVRSTRGLVSADVSRLVRSGQLVRVRRGLVALPDADEHVRLAASLGGVLSCHSAAARQGLRLLAPPRRPHVTVPRGNEAAGEGVVLHRRNVPRDGWLTERSRTVADCLRCLVPEQGVVVADSALESGVRREDVLGHLRGRGVSAPRMRLGWADGRAQAVGESVVRLRLQLAGFRAAPQSRVSGVGWVDLLVDGWLVIEVDGYLWHWSEQHLARDRRRDARLVELGYVVLRFTHRDVVDRTDDVVRTIVAVLASR